MNAGKLTLLPVATLVKVMICPCLFAISSKNAIINLGNYISEDVFPFITNEIGSQIDIDHAIDFNLAELIMKNQKLL